MPITMTRYHLPDGRTTEERVRRPADVEAKAQAFIDVGGYFEMEVLRTGQISFTIGHDDAEDGDLHVELVDPGDKWEPAFDRLVEQAAYYTPDFLGREFAEDLAGLDLEDQLDVLLGEPKADPA